MEGLQMKKYYIKLTEHERSQIIHSLIDKNNAFMAKSRYTEADESKEKGFHKMKMLYSHGG